MWWSQVQIQSMKLKYSVNFTTTKKKSIFQKYIKNSNSNGSLSDVSGLKQTDLVFQWTKLIILCSYKYNIISVLLI